MTHSVRVLERLVPQPIKVTYFDTFAFRYQEKTSRQAIVQKVARYVSGLQAAWLLNQSGFVQEQGTLQRVLDEIQEDILFLALSVIYSDTTDLHKRYLEAFYEEEFDNKTAIESTQRRPMIPRKKIRAYVARMFETYIGVEAGPFSETARTISKGYSGYVHAASTHIMDMYGGNPAHFHVSGMLGTPRHIEHRRDLWNYFYRGLSSCFISMRAFGQEEESERIRQLVNRFEGTAWERSDTID